MNVVFRDASVYENDGVHWSNYLKGLWENSILVLNQPNVYAILDLDEASVCNKTILCVEDTLMNESHFPAEKPAVDIPVIHSLPFIYFPACMQMRPAMSKVKC